MNARALSVLTWNYIAGKQRFAWLKLAVGAFFGRSAIKIKDLGIRGLAQWQAIKGLSSAAEQAG